jgi:aminoglycoside phosphotransferase (APT) family kinase protein
VTALVEGLELATVRDWLGCTRLTVQGAPGGGGWSSCTLLVEADDRPLVLRLAPTGRGMFGEHDLSVQVNCLRHVRAHGLPAPAVLATDLAGERLGRPGYAMERVPGRVPSDDQPPFTKAGFLFDATAGERRRFSTDLVDRLADVHQLPTLAGLPVGPSAADHLAWCQRQRGARRARGTGGDPLWRAHRALAGQLPRELGQPALLWGDARPANTVVDAGFAVAALLDWELAGTGPPEFDVSWLNEMNRLRAGTDPPLPGFLTEEQVWRRWSVRTGRRPRAMAWFQLFAAYRVAVLLELHLDERVRRGALPAEHPVRSENRATRRLAELLASH